MDFLEDALVNALILFALGWSARNRALVGMALAGILLVPGAATILTAWHKFNLPVAPDTFLMSTTGLGALAVNLTCAFILVRFRHHAGSMSRAAFLSARNDALANIAIIAAAGVTVFWRTGWPDLIVGVVIAALNADAARAVFTTARQEHADARFEN